MKFILVDDDEVFLLLHTMVIKESGLIDKPISFIWAQEALDYLVDDSAKNPNELYFILLDINMPKMDGWELLDALSLTSLSSKVLVAMVSSSINQEDKERAKAYPQVVKYIEKPLKQTDIEGWLKA